jgi:hypothetical protein
MKIDPPLEPS